MAGSVERARKAVGAARAARFESRTLVLCLATAGLVAALGLIGILERGIYPEGLRRTFAANDVANLCVGLPLIAACAAAAWRGKMLGRLCLPGTLLYVAYNAATYAIALPVGWLQGVHMIVLCLCAMAARFALAEIDGEAIMQAAGRRVPCRWAGGTLAVLGALFFVRAADELGLGFVGPGPMARETLGVDVADLLFAPVWALGGVLLWRRTACGFRAGGALLVQASMLFAGLMVFMVAEAAMDGRPVKIADVSVILAMGLVCFAPTGILLRAVSRGRAPAA